MPASPNIHSSASTPAGVAEASTCILFSFSACFLAAFALIFARLTDGRLHALTLLVAAWYREAGARVRGRPMPPTRGFSAGPEPGALALSLADVEPEAAVAVFSLFDVVRIVLRRVDGRALKEIVEEIAWDLERVEADGAGGGGDAARICGEAGGRANMSACLHNSHVNRVKGEASSTQARERCSGDMQSYASTRVDVSFKRPSAEEPKGMSMSQCDDMRLMVDGVSACLFDELVKCLRAT